MLDRPAIDATLAAIQELLNTGQWVAAEATCKELLQLVPQEPLAWFRLGVIHLQCGRPRDAEDALRQAIALDPGYAGSWNNLSVALREQRQSVAAEAASRQAIALDAASASHWLNLGNALYGQGCWDEASQAYRQSLAIHPGDAAAWSNLGAAEQRVGRLTAAQEAYERSLTLAPDHAGALINLAYLLIERGQPQRALAPLGRVLNKHPDLVSAWVALGNGLKLLGELTKAEHAYRQAIQLAPRHIAARYSLALLLLLRWSLPEAEALARVILADDPQCAEAWTLLGAVQQAEARSDEALAARRRSVEIDPDPDRHSMLLLGLQYAEGITAAQLLEAHREYDSAYAKPLRPANPPVFPKRDDRPLRLGFVSTDFGFHPIGFLALRALECLRELDCTIICYSDRLGEDAYTARFRAAAHEWRPVVGFSHEELADQIRRDEVDILVDLIGHVGKRLMVFARRPAPMQVTWLGYVGTTGLTDMDFLLADRYHVRPGEEGSYVEQILRMPNGYACYGPPADAPSVGPLPALATGHVTFGCFNNPAKFSPSTLDVWAEVLRCVPGSRLLLRYGGLDEPRLQARLRGQLAERGVVPERILLEGWSPHHELLNGYNRVDLALDTQPYSGGLTTCEALWMGIPVVTFPGQTFAGRHSVSYLTNAGYPQFVATDAAEFVRLAVGWANRLDELASLRAEMRPRVSRSPVCDGPTFARDLLSFLERGVEISPAE